MQILLHRCNQSHLHVLVLSSTFPQGVEWACGKQCWRPTRGLMSSWGFALAGNVKCERGGLTLIQKHKASTQPRRVRRLCIVCMCHERFLSLSLSLSLFVCAHEPHFGTRHVRLMLVCGQVGYRWGTWTSGCLELQLEDLRLLRSK